jgi:hypothetical protein
VALDRPAASGAAPSDSVSGRPRDRARLTRAEAHAQRRSTPLTPQQFKELSRLADQGISPLRHL